jgi:hypothetical protein
MMCRSAVAWARRANVAVNLVAAAGRCGGAHHVSAAVAVGWHHHWIGVLATVWLHKVIKQ